jgi:hypothetical protein
MRRLALGPAILVLILAPISLAAQSGRCGWYLMVPPIQPSKSGDEPTVDVKAPISRWSQEDTFSTLEACLAWRQSRFNVTANIKDREHKLLLEYWQDPARASRSQFDQKMYEYRLSQYNDVSAAEWAYFRALCIATDDPRLARRR